MARVAIKEESLQNLANLARQAAGTADTYDIDEAIDILTEQGSPALEELTITENGEYTPTKYGYSKVTADVQPELEDITITANGTYKSDKYGYGELTVECPPAPTDEELSFTGNCQYRFAYGGWDWVIDKYEDRITTKDITNCSNMFYSSELTEIPFQINVRAAAFGDMFKSCIKLKQCPKIRGTINWSTSTAFANMIAECRVLRNIEDLFTPEMLDGFATVKVTSAYSTPQPVVLRDLISLRQVPSWWYKFRCCPNSTVATYASYTIYYYLGYSLRYLDELKNIPVYNIGTYTSNLFNSYSFMGMGRAKDITFETNEDGSPIVAQWKSQVIGLNHSSYPVGTVSTSYVPSDNYYELSNSGITSEKRVTDDTTYQALKNDPDWFTTSVGYSRYNHDSAVNTINSLPDTSAYLATAGGTNTIKFTGAAGSATDGGAINTLTEEEIAVAASKGWTVTLS